MQKELIKILILAKNLVHMEIITKKSSKNPARKKTSYEKNVNDCNKLTSKILRSETCNKNILT